MLSDTVLLFAKPVNAQKETIKSGNVFFILRELLVGIVLVFQKKALNYSCCLLIMSIGSGKALLTDLH